MQEKENNKHKAYQAIRRRLDKALEFDEQAREYREKTIQDIDKKMEKIFGIVKKP